MSDVKLSTKAVELITAIVTNPSSTAPQIAKIMGVSVSQVTGSLASLKKAGMVEINEGLLVPTADAEFEFGSPAADTTIGGGAVMFPTAATMSSTLIDTAAPEELAADEDEPSVADTAPRSAMSMFVAAADAPPVVATKTKTAKVKAEAAPRAPTKADKARAVFEANKDAPRKVLMDLLMVEAVGLTIHGANTYIHNLRKKAGMVQARGTMPVVVGEIAVSSPTEDSSETLAPVVASETAEAEVA